MELLGCIMIVVEHGIVPFDYVRALVRSEMVYLPYWTANI